MRFASPMRRRLCATAAAALMFSAMPALDARAQEVSLIRDTETERLIRTHLDPLLRVAALSPSDVEVQIVNNPGINAFVSEGQNMFLNTGLFMELETPNQLKGVLAHETGHMADGHLVRMREGMRVATIPMLLSVAAGIAVMAVGGGDAGMAVIMGGQNIAMADFLAFTRTQESAADQAGIRYLTATEQSGAGMLEVFRRFQQEEILSDRYRDPFSLSHPTAGSRLVDLENLVVNSPYYGRTDTQEDQHAYDMVRAKLRGYTERPDVVFRRYPPNDTSQPARYARTIAYLRQPDMNSALGEIDSLLAEEPDNPYFLEVKAEVNVQMGRVTAGIEPYRRAVSLLPDAPLMHVALGAALLGTEDPRHLEEAKAELQRALDLEPDYSLTWYYLAQAYGREGNTSQAQLATAERYFAVGSYPEAMQFAFRAQTRLPRGSTEWQRASDIMAIAQARMPNNRNRN